MKKQSNGMGNLMRRYKNKFYPANAPVKGVFYLRYRDEDGTRKTIRLTRHGEPITEWEEAKEEQRRLRAPYMAKAKIETLKGAQAIIREEEERRKKAEEAAAPPMTIEEAWDKWEELAALQICQGSKGNYKRHWESFVKYCRESGKMAEKGRYLRDITPEMARGRIKELQAQNRTPNTVNKHLNFLKSFFEVLKKAARLDENPFQGIKRLKLTTNSRRTLSIEEIQSLLNATEGEMHTLFLLGACTGMRCGDCVTLRWAEVDLLHGVIRRKANKTRHSSGAEIIAGIPNGLSAELAAIPAPHGEYVMPGLAAMYNESYHKIVRRIRNVFDACGIATTRKDEKGRQVIVAGFHSLRHTWVSIQAMRGTPQAVIMAMVGHSNPAMTEHYTHVSFDAARQAARELPAFTENEGEAARHMAELRTQATQIVETADEETLQRMIKAAKQE